MNSMQKQIKNDMEPKLEATTVKVNTVTGKVETLNTKVVLELTELKDSVTKVLRPLLLVVLVVAAATAFLQQLTMHLTFCFVCFSACLPWLLYYYYYYYYYYHHHHRASSRWTMTLPRWASGWTRPRRTATLTSCCSKPRPRREREARCEACGWCAQVRKCVLWYFRMQCSNAVPSATAVLYPIH